jgi:hypothetical protein
MYIFNYIMCNIVQWWTKTNTLECVDNVFLKGGSSFSQNQTQRKKKKKFNIFCICSIPKFVLVLSPYLFHLP